MMEAMTGVVGTRPASSFRRMAALHDRRYDKSQVFQRFGPQVAGVAVLAGHEYPRRAFQSVDASVHPGHTGTHAQAVQAVARPAVVHTSHHDIHPSQQAQPHVVADVAHKGQYVDGGIDVAEAFCRYRCLVAACFGVGPAEEDGAGQVGRLDGVEVHDDQMLHAEQGQVLQHLVAQRAAAHHHDVGLLQPLLSEPGEQRKHVRAPCGS